MSVSTSCNIATRSANGALRSIARVIIAPYPLRAARLLATVNQDLRSRRFLACGSAVPALLWFSLFPRYARKKRKQMIVKYLAAANVVAIILLLRRKRSERR